MEDRSKNSPAAAGGESSGAVKERTRGSSRRRKRSLATREEIIEATIDCFIEIGYFRTTTTEIAKKAGVTRGAVQHYFPTTQHVLEASIEYLATRWLDEYMEAAGNAPPGADYIDYAVDVLWEFVNNRLFVAWRELMAASRTDSELREIIEPVAAQFEQLRRDMGRKNFPEFADASIEKFQRHRDTLRFVLEGIAGTVMTYDTEARIKAQLDFLKAMFHESWEEEMDQDHFRRR
ncbi:MAG: TetR/AcrR family transcriptional regulator [Alphaproteobacteria bacterium]|nr:TetR/AcrR family transcriptional regulator [Alphaproteobacteria bacterium]